MHIGWSRQMLYHMVIWWENSALSVYLFWEQHEFSNKSIPLLEYFSNIIIIMLFPSHFFLIISASLLKLVKYILGWWESKLDRNPSFPLQSVATLFEFVGPTQPPILRSSHFVPCTLQSHVYLSEFKSSWQLPSLNHQILVLPSVL